MITTKPLDVHCTLGRSGLGVSPLALGTMTFGTARWGSDEGESRAVFDAYVDLGGNFLDTADVYSSGRSEEMLGRFVADRGLRDRLVLATKAGFGVGDGAHRGGNGAKHVLASLDASLRRLGTDYVDLFWLHVWDSVTPAEEIVETMATIVRSGRARYWGLSNVPAWLVARIATLASARGLPGPIAVQSFYSLVDRDVELEHVPAARELGIGLVPWSPLAFGLLTGKYDRATVEAAGPRAGGLPSGSESTEPRGRRLDGANPFGDSLFTERNWEIVDVVRRVATELGTSPAHVALAWVRGRPGVGSVLIGASRASQLVENVEASLITLAAEHRTILDTASAPPTRALYRLFEPETRRHAVFGGTAVAPWRAS